MKAFRIKFSFWIGLRKHESFWLWVNGEYAASAAIYWQNNKPNNPGVDQDCARIRVNINHQNKKYGRTTADGVVRLEKLHSAKRNIPQTTDADWKLK